MRDIWKKIRAIPRFWWIAVTILAIGIFLRTYHHHDWLRFNADQGRDAELVSRAVDGTTAWPLLGPKAGGTQFKLGPAFYWFEITSAKLFGNTPDRMAFPDLFTSILSIPLLFFFLRKYFGKYESLSLTAVFAVSLYLITYARFGWNPNSTPFWTILALYALHEVFSEKNNRKYSWAAIAGAAIGIGVQLHTTLLVIFPATLAIMFFYYAIRNRGKLKYFFVILALLLLTNAPQLVSETRSKWRNEKAFFRAIQTKSHAESLLSDNTVHATSCWVQGNIYIISGYEISDTCAFDPSKSAPNSIMFLLGLLFIAGGTALGAKYFLDERDAERRLFLAVVFAFSAVSFLVFLKMAFELSVRFYLPLIYFPFILLGFWMKFLENKFGYRLIVPLLSVLFIISNIFFVGKYFIALADYTNPRGGTTAVQILGEAETYANFIVANSGGAKNVYINGDEEFLFKSFKSIGYLVGRKNIKLTMVKKFSPVPSSYFFHIEHIRSGEISNSGGFSDIVARKAYGKYEMLFVKNN